MRSFTYLIIAALLALTLTLPAVMWPPYDDMALLAPRLQHLAALMAAVLALCLPLLDAARRAAQQRRTPVVAAIARSWFLGVGALASLALFAATYAGLSYGMFWTAILALCCVLAVMLFSSGHAAVQAQERDDDAAVVRRRKLTAQQDLDALHATMRAHAAPDAAGLAAVARLAEEVRFMPDQSSGPEAAALFARLTTWRANAADGLGAGHEQAAVLAPALMREANDLAKSFANWKR